MKKKALAILLSVLMLTSVTLPGTWANPDSTNGEEIDTEDTAWLDEIIDDLQTTFLDETDENADENTENESEETIDAPESQNDDTVIGDDTTGEVADEMGEDDFAEDADEDLTENEDNEDLDEEYFAEDEDNEDFLDDEYLAESEEVITETVTILDSVGDCAPPFTSAGPLIEYDTPATMSLFSTYGLRGGISTYDADDSSVPQTSGLELKKEAKANENGTYTITLEAYATGESVSTYVRDGVDIVLMLDLSDYMGKATTTVGDTTVDTNTTLSSLYTNYTNGIKYYYQSGGKYYEITITRTQNSYGGGMGGGPGGGGSNNNEYSYSITYNNGTTIVSNKNGDTKLSNAASSYPGGNNQSVTLYTQTTTYDTSDLSKLNALQKAVNSFIDKVHTNAPASRIAIVTYADNAEVKSGSLTATDGALVTVDDAGVTALKAIVNGLSIATGASNSHYAAADAVKIFQAVDKDSAEYSRQRVAILFSAGVPGTGWATENKSVLTTGNSIAQATMTQAYILKSEKGQTVTDPGGNVDGGAKWEQFSGTDIYTNTVYIGCGATFYSVGLDIPTSGNPAEVSMKEEPYKSGALANEYFWRSSSHRLNGTHIFYGYSSSENYETAVEAAFGSTGLNVYKNRYNQTTYGSLYYFYPDELTRNQDNGYYLTTTSDSTEGLEELTKIFSKIAGHIETDSSTSTTLGTSTVIKDIMSPQFQLPGGTTAENITVTAYDCNGKNTDGECTFSNVENKAVISGTTPSVDNGVVSVTGFDFAANWCGTDTDKDENTTNHGSKLVISFTVVPKDGFLGGNDVYTNATQSGVYTDNTTEEPLDTFNRPTVNVPIKDITVTTTEKNVYLLGGMTADEIKNGTKVKVGADANGDGGVTIDLTKADSNYGLDDWQTEYVTIGVTYMDKDGNTVNEPTDLTDLTDDTTYTVTVTITPKSNGTQPNEDGITAVGTPATAQTGNGEGTINVFKPELTYKDGQINNGDPVPSDDTFNSKNYVFSETVWKHGDTLSTSTDITMSGTAPTLSFKYHPEAEKVKDNKINTNTDKVAVDVKVYIGKTEDSEGTEVTAHVKFNHEDCTIIANCPDVVNGKFWLHILTTSLTITKTVNETVDDGQTFVFTVSGGGVEIPVVIHGASSVTIDGLKVGTTYTVTEDTSWSWRYEIDGENNQQITLGADKTKNDVTFNNTRTEEKWLDANAYADNKWSGQDDVALDTNNSYNATDTKKRRIS